MYEELFRTLNREKIINDSILKIKNLSKENKLELLKEKS